MIIGYVIGESKPTKVSGLSSRPLSIGEYVLIDSEEGKILGLVERSFVSSVALADVKNFEEASESKEIAEINKRDKGYTSQIMILGFVEKLQQGQSIVPAIPPLPGSEILEATREDLEKVFGPVGNEWIKIGTILRNPEIDAKVNLNSNPGRPAGNDANCQIGACKQRTGQARRDNRGQYL